MLDYAPALTVSMAAERMGYPEAESSRSRWSSRDSLSRKDAAQVLVTLAERAHGDSGLPYEAYLRQLATLRLVAHELGLPVPDEVFAVRTPRRGKLRGGG